MGKSTRLDRRIASQAHRPFPWVQESAAFRIAGQERFGPPGW